MQPDIFSDGTKVDDSKKHLLFRPAYAKIDKKNGLVCIWDYGPNYASFKEMAAQRKEVSAEKMHAGINSNPGLQFANRGLGVAMVLEYHGDRYLVATCKKDSNTLSLINGYFGNGIGEDLENESIPERINVVDNILRTSAAEIFEEFNAIHGGEVLTGEVTIVKGSVPVTIKPFENCFPYAEGVQYRVLPSESRLECLTNLHGFHVAKTNSAEDKNPVHMGDNVGAYFDPFHNCYQIVTSVQTGIKEVDFLFQTEDKYRDEKGMDTYLNKEGIRLIRLDDSGLMLPQVYRAYVGELERVAHEGLFVSESLIPKNPETETVIAPRMRFSELF